MKQNTTQLDQCQKSGRLMALLTIVLWATIFLWTGCAENNTVPDVSTDVRRELSAADTASVSKDISEPATLSIADADAPNPNIAGPTLLLGYSKETFQSNPIASFMYFVPLIAPTQVDNISSVNNAQEVGIISHTLKTDSKSFHVICEFEISGTGFHENTFDPAGMIAAHTEELKKGQTLTHMLDYIKFDGQGLGVIEVKGRIVDSEKTITEVNMQFNAKGRKSPVTVGLYDIKPVDGQYLYENKSNPVVARVNTLAFKKTEKTPKMGIKVASISKSEEVAGFWGRIKGAIANLLIEPPKIEQLGNTTMLEFGEVLLRKKTTFTFPLAKNIKENIVVEICSEQE